jgi:phosphate transport system substrate-binding protein
MKRIIAITVAAIMLIAITVFYLSTPGESKGTVKVSGAWALYPMMVKWAEEYQKTHPVTVEVSAGGAGKGMTDALAGLVDIGMISRGIYQEEIDKGAFYVGVTKDAVVAVINKDNPVLGDILSKGLTKQTFSKIYISGEITKWGQAVGSSVADEIHVYTRSDAAGAPESWANYLGKKQDDLKGIGVYGDPGLLEAVKKDNLGIGYNNIGYAYDMDTKKQVDGIVVVPIDINGNGHIDTEESFYSTKDKIVEAIGENIYPHPPARVLFLATKGKFTDLAKEFVQWILTDGQAYVKDAGYVPLPVDVINQQIAKLAG